MFYTWKARDQPEKELRELLNKRYLDIEQSFNLLKKVYDINDAKKIVNEIWNMKAFCSEIELELMRRSWNNGTSSTNE